MAHREGNGRNGFSLLRGVEILFLVCALVCLGFLIRGVSSDARERASDRAMREQIQRLSQQAGEAEEAAAEGKEARGFSFLNFGSALAEEIPIESISAAAVEDGGMDPSVAPMMEAAFAAGPDVVGILEAGNDIALYVPQGSDNDFYLTHDVAGKYSDAGAAFLDYRCQLDPRSTHLMIHGHNMRSGAIFGDLDKYRDAAYLAENSIVYWTTQYGREAYVPYAVAEISVSTQDSQYFKMTIFDFDTDEMQEKFAFILKTKSDFELPVDVQGGDELLSLVTCSYGYDNGRLVLALRKVRDGEDVEALAQQIRDALENPDSFKA